jgi:hypothetical protein
MPRGCAELFEDHITVGFPEAFVRHEASFAQRIAPARPVNAAPRRFADAGCVLERAAARRLTAIRRRNSSDLAQDLVAREFHSKMVFVMKMKA